MKKERSRAYPLLDLEAAYEILRRDLTGLRGGVDRNRLAEILGYSSAGGGIAARKIGAMVQYGLIDRHTKVYRVSVLGRRLQHQSPAAPEFRTAIQTALRKPTLFRQILDRFYPVGRLPEDLAFILTQEEFGITDRASEEAAEVFIRSARFVGVLDEEGRFQELSRNSAPFTPEPALPVSRRSNSMLFALTGGREAKLEFPRDMTAADLKRLESRLNYELAEGSLWQFVGLERPTESEDQPMQEQQRQVQAEEQPTDGSGENPNVIPFGNRPGNQAT